MSNPRIYLIASPKIREMEIQRFLDDRGTQWLRSEEASSAEELVELGGRICYMSFSRDPSKVRFPNRKYISNLIQQGHDSVLEHATWTLLVDRVSRAFTHQLVRHRIGFSFSQLSQQYHDESDSGFVAPKELSESPELQLLWQESVEAARNSYRQLLSELMKDTAANDREARRRIRSAARSLLPNATETAVAVTANARALRHFFTIRGAVIGDIEMRQVAYGVFKLVEADAPALFADFEAGLSSDDGWPIVQPKTRQPKINLEMEIMHLGT